MEPDYKKPDSHFMALIDESQDDFTSTFVLKIRTKTKLRLLSLVILDILLEWLLTFWRKHVYPNLPVSQGLNTAIFLLLSAIFSAMLLFTLYSRLRIFVLWSWAQDLIRKRNALVESNS